MNESNCTRRKTLTPEQTHKISRATALCPVKHHNDNGLDEERAQEVCEGLLRRDESNNRGDAYKTLSEASGREKVLLTAERLRWVQQRGP